MPGTPTKQKRTSDTPAVTAAAESRVAQDELTGITRAGDAWPTVVAIRLSGGQRPW